MYEASIIIIIKRFDEMLLRRETKRRELTRTNLLGFRSDPAFWTDSNLWLGYFLDVVIKLKLCWMWTQANIIDFCGALVGNPGFD